MTDVAIRAVEDGDIASVVALWWLAGLLRPWNDPHRDIAFARSHEHSTLLVATDADAVIGSLMVGHDGHRGWFYYVATHPDRRREGLGRALVAAGEHWLSARGVWKAQLLVRGDNSAATGFYAALGYRDTQATCMQKVLESQPDAGPASPPATGTAGPESS